MHHHLEIIMPPTDDVEAAVKKILAPYDEGGEDEDGDPNRYAFWDYWLIGGRWSGSKLKEQLGQERLSEFHKELAKRQVTVSGIQFGKQELQPESQIPMVDALWNEFFPDSPVKTCPIFKHYKEEYGEIMSFKDAPKSLGCVHVIFAAPTHDGKSMEPKFMITDTVWNGVNHIRTTWDETLGGAVAMYSESLKNYREEYAEKITPKDDWIVITVDYHS